MKILIVYYSFEGNCKFVAEEISRNVNAEILELKVRADTNSQDAIKYLFGDTQTIAEIKPELFPLEKDIDSYDFIFLGSPVKSWDYAPALKTFFAENKIKEKKIALFCCSEGEVGETLKNMRRELRENEVMGEMEFINPLKHLEYGVSAKIGNWVDYIMETF